MKERTSANSSSSERYSSGSEGNRTTRCVRRLFSAEYGTRITPPGSSTLRSIFHLSPSKTMNPVAGSAGSYTVSSISPVGSVAETTGRNRFFSGVESGIGCRSSFEELSEVFRCPLKFHEELIEPASLTDLGRKRHDPGLGH